MATNTLYAYKPDYAVHPGEYLEEVLEVREIKKREMSERLGISVKHLSQIINRQASVTADMAIQLEKALSISANIWNNLNANYALFEARAKETQELSKHLKWIKEFPVKDLKKLGFLPSTRDPKSILESLLRFFGTSSPEKWQSYYGKLSQISFRKSGAYSDNLHHIVSWLRAGEISVRDVETAGFSKVLFKKSLRKIRELTTKSPSDFEPVMRKLCAESGVALVFMPEFEKTHLSGVTRWLTQDKALIVMSLRHKTNDHFWFTFFHEVGHIVLHGKKEIFIDDAKGFDSDKENEANRFARNILIPEDAHNKFTAEKRFYPADIKTFANSIRVHPGIVVGRLQYDKLIKYNWHNNLKERFQLKIPSSRKE
ncbi:MAG: HigA family addiction module antitoxin [Candidatus Zixiibacteriota bacterium]